MKRSPVFLIFFCVVANDASARDQIRIVGSGTVYPFVTAAAEEFGKGGDFKTPIVEATGTGGGFKLFCEGNGDDKPDINDASRKITPGERATCEKNGVTDIAEVQLGFDGIVIAGKKGTQLLNLTKKDLFLALAREIPDANGQKIKNPNLTWHDVDAALPDMPIMLYGPPPTSGTRDTFVELVMAQGCAQIPAMAKLLTGDADSKKKACELLREDGKYIESGEDFNVVIEKLVGNEQALGIMGYNFYSDNINKIQANKIDGVLPETESIESGRYGISRGLYVYVKRQHIGVVKGIPEFIGELTSDAAIGQDGYITEAGLLPLPEAQRKAEHAAARGMAVK